MEAARKTVRTSVRALVEFILRSGDLDNRRGSVSDLEAMAAGSRIHRKIQQRRGAGYTPEVPLRYERVYPDYTLVIEGRADGICRLGGRAAAEWSGEEDLPAAPFEDAVLIEEIKGVYADLSRFEEPVPVHLAQAMCYACIYGLQNDLDDIRICMTYVHLESEAEKKFIRAYRLEELTEWFEELLAAYHRWAGFQVEWESKRNASMQNLEFPFDYRPGQRKLVADIYRTVLRRKQLFVQAPTGIGKTMSAVFPSVRAIGEGYGEKIFYLTAKTVTRTVAEEAFGILRGRGLCFKSLTITSKEKTCILDEPDCNPASCPRAKGHFDRVNQALWQMLTEDAAYSRGTVLRYAEAWNVCPFEMQLDLSWFCDAVICDYNYVFDPTARLKRFFGETGRKGDWIFLIDEAHNLVERGREMFSAGLYREDFRDARAAAGEELEHVEELLHSAGTGKRKKRKGKKTPGEGQMSLFPVPEPEQRSISEKIPEDNLPAMPRGREKEKLEDLRLNLIRFRKAAERCSKVLLQYRHEHEALRNAGEPAGEAGLAGSDLRERESAEEFAVSLLNLAGVLEEVLSDMRDCEVRRTLLNFYFDVCGFLDMYELLDENYIIYTGISREDRFYLKLFCVNPAANLQACLDRGRSAVFYSATLLPVKYYQSLLSGRDDDYAVYIRSPFDTGKRLLLIGRDVSSRYTRRTPDEYERFAAYIRETAEAKPGRYLVFFPSYRMLRDILEVFTEHLREDSGIRCLCQTPAMSEGEREDFLEAFRDEPDQGTLIGFCVMGGIFSEGIDLYGDRLIGAIVIGTGLPQIGEERELLKRYYDRSGQNGFDYAYRFPGMNKVQQAAGRVIRTTEDVGVILLLDERFGRPENRQLFPVEWSDAQMCTLRSAPEAIRRFWDREKI